jgi:hypothetical protein
MKSHCAGPPPPLLIRPRAPAGNWRIHPCVPLRPSVRYRTISADAGAQPRCAGRAPHWPSPDEDHASYEGHRPWADCRNFLLLPRHDRSSPNARGWPCQQSQQRFLWSGARRPFHLRKSSWLGQPQPFRSASSLFTTLLHLSHIVAPSALYFCIGPSHSLTHEHDLRPCNIRRHIYIIF